MSTIIAPRLEPLRAAFPFIAFRDNLEPYGRAQRCGECGATFADVARMACANCGARDAFQEIEIPSVGTLHSYTIVYRAFAGTETPFISAIVDFGDVTLKGSLRGISFSPDAIKIGMAVKLVFDDALGRTDAQGHRYISHFFEPA